MTTGQSIQAFFHAATNTVSYVVAAASGDCVIIDPALDFDPKSGATGTAHADAIIDYVGSGNLTLRWILETHVHADHVTAAPHIKRNLGGEVVIGSRITEVQETFGDLLNLPNFPRDGSQFDRLVADGDELELGELKITVLHTPGHTPACVCYVIGDAVFVGDTMFMPDGGTARADFPGGDAALLFHSLQRILSLHGKTRVFVCHDYGPGGRDIAWQTSIAEQRSSNIHLKDRISEAEYVRVRKARDATLQVPALLLPAVQINMNAGVFPAAESNGVSYLKLPLNAFS